MPGLHTDAYSRSDSHARADRHPVLGLHASAHPHTDRDARTVADPDTRADAVHGSGRLPVRNPNANGLRASLGRRRLQRRCDSH
jgi:hypothetical protein